MNVILGWLETLLAGKPIRDTLSALDIIRRNARSQAKLIDELLDMNRLLAGNVRMELSPIDLDSTLDGAIQSLQPVAKARGVRVNAPAAASGIRVLADSGRLQQILWNILQNAIKFTAKGGQVDVRVEEAMGQVRIVVQDSGRGITQDFLPHVFERFRQQDSSSTRESPGLGIGLSIAKHLVELHGGTIRAYSDGQGSGATFTVELLAAADDGVTVADRDDAAVREPA